LSPTAKTTDPLFDNAVAQHKAGKIDQAIAAYAKVLSTNPKHFNACHLLGVALHHAGRSKEAAAVIAQAIQLNGNVPDAHYNLAAVHLRLGRPDLALHSVERALALRADYPEAWLTRGVSQLKLGKLDQAEASFTKALAQRPGFAQAHNNLGSLKENKGEFGAAIANWQRAIDAKPDYAEAYRNLAQHKVSALRPSDLKQMEALAGAGTLAPKDLAFINFALFEARHAAKQHDAAFAHLNRANELMHAQVPFKVEAERSMVESVRAAFSKEVINEGARRGSQSDKPIFIIGMPRSGTSLVEQIIASHPQVTGAGELIYMAEVARPFMPKADSLPVWQWGDAGIDLEQLADTYLAHLDRIAPEARHVTDKMPSNFYFAGLIGMILPRAKIMHVTRHPMATGFACYRRRFDVGHGFSYDLQSIGQFYGLYRSLMAHWHAVMPGQILDVSYEALVSDPEPAVRTMLAHCELDWDDACLRFHENRRTVKTASAMQVRQPIYTSSVESWKQYAAHLQPLANALKDAEVCV
jgi:tetratricopeptide (TPR) repeat protein